jgi:hypothetical protein
LSVKLLGGQAPPADETTNLFIYAHGFPGTGKTSFGFTGPAPYWVFNVDRPIDPILPKLPAGVEVEYEHIADDVDAVSMATAKGHLGKFDAMLKEALRANQGTFMLDGADLFWDIVKVAKIPGGTDDAMPKEWAEANTYMNGAMRRLGQSGLQVVFTSISSKIWTGAKTETERVKADGFKHRARWLTHEVYFFTPENPTEPFAAPKQLAQLGQTHNAYIGMSKLLTFSLLYKLTTGRAYPDAAKLWSPAKSVEPEAIGAPS